VHHFHPIGTSSFTCFPLVIETGRSSDKPPSWKGRPPGEFPRVILSVTHEGIFCGIVGEEEMRDAIPEREVSYVFMMQRKCRKSFAG
jgi:hypothetical protein